MDMEDPHGTPSPAAPRVPALAWASLVLGILGLLTSIAFIGVLFAISAVVCGDMALARVKATAAAERRRGVAVAGVVTGYVGILASLAVVVFVVTHPLSAVRHGARRINCAGNLKQIALAVRMYSTDYGGQFPNDLSMLVHLEYLTALKVFTCPETCTPEAPTLDAFCQGGYCDYLYLGRGLTEACNGHDPKTTILGCDRPGNDHQGYLNVLFADGHVKDYRCSGDLDRLARRHRLYLPGD